MGSPWHAWRAPLLVGAGVRLLSAWFSLSFHARDDYFHVLLPALTWEHDPNFDWDHSDLPGAGIRSHLLPRLVWCILRACHGLGIDNPEAVLRIIYACMGAYSLTLVPAMYSAAARHFDAATARRAAWLGALFFPFPYAGTRLLIEALAMPPLCAAFALAPVRGRRAQVAAGLMFGLAFWWRFHVVLAALGWAVVLWVQTRRGQRTWGENFALKGGFLLAVAAQGLFDLATSDGFLMPLVRNILINLNPPNKGLSRSTPWGYVAMLLVLTLPPATLWLLPRLWRAMRLAPGIGAALASFVLLHSLIPHKEDRFLLPVIPLYAVLLAAALGMEVPAPRSWRWIRGYAYALLAVGLGIAITSQSQANLRDAMIVLRQDPQARGVVSVGPELQLYFLGDRPLPSRQAPHPDEDWLHNSIVQMAAADRPPNRFLAYARDRQVIEVMLRLEGYACSQPETIEGWWLDRQLAQLNPRRNRRRSPVLLYRCDPPALAAAGNMFMATRAAAPESLDAPTENLGRSAPRRPAPH